MHRFGDKLQKMLFNQRKENAKGDVSSVIETAFLYNSPYVSRRDSVDQQSDDSAFSDDFESSNNNIHMDTDILMSSLYESFEENLDEEQCQQLSQLLRSCLLEGQKKLSGRLMIPANLLARIAKDVIRMSHCEPYGLRGCVLFVDLETKSGTQSLGHVAYDAFTVATFELHLTLKEECAHWYNLSDLLTMLMPCQDEKYVSPGFQLVKKKLYRHNQSLSS